MIGREYGLVLTHTDICSKHPTWYKPASRQKVVKLDLPAAYVRTYDAGVYYETPVADAVLASSQTLGEDPHPRYTILSDMDFGPDQFIRTHLLAYC